MLETATAEVRMSPRALINHVWNCCAVGTKLIIIMVTGKLSLALVHGILRQPTFLWKVVKMNCYHFDWSWNHPGDTPLGKPLRL